METWNKRLTIAREAAGLTKTNLAQKVGVSNPTVTDWENGEIKKLEAENLLNICEILKIRPRWLQFGEGKMRDLYDDPKINRVSVAMQSMPEYKKDMIVQASTTLSEPTQQKDVEAQ